eukprot:TRINITY_DN26245_c0_g1_i3.p1 TRINITY_DN26245_c0_g1~~TRINITY_DN26245_c0_g1_i3.p1  ORF type:complete len:216 (+),score=50.94 TRINITY_DN26245_c0_g1_i3:334-981(+)
MRAGAKPKDHIAAVAACCRGGPDNVCEVMHPGMSCGGHYADFLVKHLAFSLRLYLPLNVIATIVFRWKKLKAQPGQVMVRMTKSVLRSSLFLSLYCANAWGMQCLLRRLGVYNVVTQWIFVGVAAGLPILLEDEGRRLELAIYCLSPVVQSMYTIGMYQAKVLPKIPRNTRGAWRFHIGMLHCFSMGVIMMAHQMGGKQLQPHFATILKNLVGLN